MELAQNLVVPRGDRCWGGHGPRGNAGRPHTILIQHSPQGEERQRQRGTVFRNCKSIIYKRSGGTAESVW